MHCVFSAKWLIFLSPPKVGFVRIVRSVRQSLYIHTHIHIQNLEIRMGIGGDRVGFTLHVGYIVHLHALVYAGLPLCPKPSKYHDYLVLLDQIMLRIQGRNTASRRGNNQQNREGSRSIRRNDGLHSRNNSSRKSYKSSDAPRYSQFTLHVP